MRGLMVDYYLMPADELLVFLGKMMEKRPVMGVRERKSQPGSYLFDWLERPEDFVAEYVTTTLPPKKAFFPPKETLFSYELSQPPDLKLEAEERGDFVLAGVHPCDLAAIDALDHAYSAPPAETRWPACRSRCTIVGIDCMPDGYCFCSSLGTCDSRLACDFFLTPVDRGYLLEVHNPAEKRWLESISLSPASGQDLEQAEDWRRRKVKTMRAGLEAGAQVISQALEQGGLKEIWQEVADRCYSCGSCNTTCPTCFCFDIRDEFDESLTGGIRCRTWDSCQLLDFAVVAGGHNFREARWQRVRHRWHRKFLYLYRQFGRPYCTGCGRCSRACTADINIVDVTNDVIAHFKDFHG
jgi:sulfhydrogenase subunit beta (sulfur reductase)